jgi:hypothetical protein
MKPNIFAVDFRNTFNIIVYIQYDNICTINSKKHGVYFKGRRSIEGDEKVYPYSGG